MNNKKTKMNKTEEVKKLKETDGKLLKHYMNLCVDGMDDTLKAAMKDDRFCFGWLNELEVEKKKKYVVFLDYDNVSAKNVEDDMKILQKKFRLGPAIILKTKHGYHGYFIDAMPQKEMLKVMEAAGYADKRYYNVGKKFGCKFVLRLGMKKDSKIEYRKIILSNNHREFSYYHLHYLMRKFPKILFDLMDSNYMFNSKDAAIGKIKCGVYSMEQPKK